MQVQTRAVLALLAVFGPSLMPAPANAAEPLGVATLAVAPTIDGEIGDAEWLGAAVADQNFVQI
jgi:hypothetical protein